MLAPWFHVDTLPPAGATWHLSRDEAKHATGSKRLGAGDAIVLFDGTGRIAEATLGAERSVDGSLLVRIANNVERQWTGRRVHLACAFPKGDRLSTLVDMTTQLGLASFGSLRCERSIVGETDARADRIRRVQIEACKQTRWPWLPELRPETAPLAIAASRGAIVVAHPGGETAAALGALAPNECTLCIGPEGGFTDREVAALCGASGARMLDLGANLLRVEAAAVVALAALRI